MTADLLAVLAVLADLAFLARRRELQRRFHNAVVRHLLSYRLPPRRLAA